MIELAKSATTRNLIGTFDRGCNAERRMRELLGRTGDQSFQKRLADALRRFEGEARRRGL